MSFNDITDNELLYLVRNNNQQAKDYLFSRYKRRMYGMIHSFFKKTGINRIDYDDVFQDCFIVFLKCIDKFDEEYNFYNYINFSIQKTLVKIIQSEKENKSVLSLDYDVVENSKNLIDVVNDNEMLYRKNELEMFIDENFSTLDKVIIEYRLKGYTICEIATILNLNKKMLYARFSTIKRNFSRYISN